jgi:uncharacterized protein (TIGR02687 family)
VYFLQPDNQFQTKIFLERVDTTTNYLIYAPFPKPDVRDNHLEDTMLYSRRFFADRASLLSVDLGIEEKYKPIIEKHIKFFANKDRTQRFYDLEIENFNEENILVGLLSAICHTRTCSFEEVTRVILTEGELEDNRFLEEFSKYDLLDSFWKLCEQHFGYTDVKPTLEKLVVTMFVTYTDKYVQADLPKPWKIFVSYKSGNIIAFLDSLMNSVLYREHFDKLSDHVAAGLNVRTALENYQPETLVDCDTFLCIDQMLQNWIVDRLMAEDTGAKLNGLAIPQICDKRIKMHFGGQLSSQYQLLSSAYNIIGAATYCCPDDFQAIVNQYCSKDCLIDQEYRKFYYHLDKIDDMDDFEQLRILVENIYANEYLATQLPQWNKTFDMQQAINVLPFQRRFYDRYLRSAKDRTVVIVSDAMRYEVGRELFAKIQDDPKCMRESKMECMLSTLPSYTRLGMAALLPNKELTMSEDYEVYVNGQPTKDLTQRQTIIQSVDKDGYCIQFDELVAMKGTEFKSFFTGKHLIYVYHNQIDARGDKQITEHEVFAACEEAVAEIVAMIQKIAGGGNTYRFVVTADHGFLYRRDKMTESDKISSIKDKQAFKNRRFVIAEEPVVDEGVSSVSLGLVLGNQDERQVSFPISSNIFKIAGGGQNYVHGGSSPQEMLVPVIEIKMDRGYMKTSTAKIALVSMVQKITNLITTLEFIQSDAVSDTVKATNYKIFFMSEDNEKISNENIYVADKRDEDPQKRIFRMRFTFKNKRYDKSKQYYLVVFDEATGLECWRHPVIMDLAFADDFGFGF